MSTDQRRFSVSDAVMMDAGRRHLTQFPNYSTNFQTLDAETFDENFIINFGALISKAEDIPSDEALQGDLMSETEDLTEVRGECVDFAGRCKYYVKKASKGDRGFVKNFNYGSLDDARDSNIGMTDFIREFNIACSSKKSHLLAAGMPEHFFVRGEELEAAMIKEKREQDQAKFNRKDMTKLRIETLNTIWDTMAILSDANQYANPGDETAKEIFSLPYPDAPSEESAE